MNGICLLDRYLNVRTVTQRHQSSATPTSRNSPSLVSSTTSGASKTIIEDNPFHSQAKPLAKITLPPPPSSATSLVSVTTPGVATSTFESNPFLSPATTPGAPIKVVEDNPFLSPAMPLMKVTLPPPGTPTAVSGVSTEFSQPPLTPGPAQLMQFPTPVQPPTPLFPSAVSQQPIAIASNPPPLLQEAQTPKVLPLNPFLEPSYSPAPPNPFFQNLRCMPPLPPPPLELTPPFAPPHFLPPPPQQTPPPAPPLFLPPPPQQTPPLAPPPPIPLFPSPFNNGGGLQSNSSSAQPVPLFPDISSLPSQQDGSQITVQSDDRESATSENSQSLTFDTAHLATSFQTPPSTPDGEATVQLSNSMHVPTDNHTSHSGSVADVDSEMDFEPAVNGDGNSWSQLNGGDHERLHKGRIHANDHPTWLKRETKAKLAQYHLQTLALELHKLKKSINTS